MGVVLAEFNSHLSSLYPQGGLHKRILDTLSNVRTKRVTEISPLATLAVSLANGTVRAM